MHTALRAKSVTENVIFVLKHFLIEFFYIFSIFPSSSGTYFYDIFDQKQFRPKSSEMIDFKVGRSDPKVGAVIGPKQPHTGKA